MKVEFIDRDPEPSTTGIDHIEPGDCFMVSGNCYLVTDAGNVVRLTDGCFFSGIYFEDEVVEVVNARAEVER